MKEAIPKKSQRKENGKGKNWRINVPDITSGVLVRVYTAVEKKKSTMCLCLKDVSYGISKIVDYIKH